MLKSHPQKIVFEERNINSPELKYFSIKYIQKCFCLILLSVISLSFCIFESYTSNLHYFLRTCLQKQNYAHSILNFKSLRPNQLPWYFTNGTVWPKPSNKSTRNLLSDPQNILNDRIINQLMLNPTGHNSKSNDKNLKKILIADDWTYYNITEGSSLFIESKCPVSSCYITNDLEEAPKSDLLIFKYSYMIEADRFPQQIYLIHMLESPANLALDFTDFYYNWTATYRSDSDIVTPYGKWVYYNDSIQQLENKFTFAERKTKKVAWFVSNCFAGNGRLKYAQELGKYIQVDIYGECGSLSCSKDNNENCFELLKNDYKFYLSFENSNCNEYITEKFYINALQNNVIPIVMGARPEDYNKIAPKNSFIHVDEFETPKKLAEYLKFLDKEDDAYYSYFKWMGTGEFINTHFWCRLCALLNDEDTNKEHKWYPELNEWWKGSEICRN